MRNNIHKYFGRNKIANTFIPKFYIMKFNLLFITIVLSVFSCNSQKIPKVQNDLQKNNLFGNISEITEVSNSDAFKINELDKKTVDKYDEEGFLKESAIIRQDSSISIKSLYTYDADRNLIEENWISEDYSDNRIERQFDNKGRMTNYLFYDNNEVTMSMKFEYDDENNTLKQYEYFSEGKLSSIMEYKFDENDFLKESSWYDENGKFQNKTVFINDDSGKPVEVKFYKSDDKLKSTTIYKYDEFNNEILTSRNSNDANFVYHIETQYKYDKYGNWTEQVRMKGGIPMFIYKREIKYY